MLSLIAYEQQQKLKLQGVQETRGYSDRPHSAIGYNVPIIMHFPGNAASPSP